MTRDLCLVDAYRRRMTASEITSSSATELVITPEQALRWGSRLVMMSAGRVVLDLGAAEKRGLGVVDLVERFHRRTGELFAEDRALLVPPPGQPERA